jgi:glucosamine-phosphate N-acetyltransferase
MYNIKYTYLLNLINTNEFNHTKLNEIKTMYINLLKNLTITEDMPINLFIQQIEEISKNGNIIIAVYESESNNDLIIIGSGTVIIESKIIHSCRPVAHIEDIVVHPDYRGKGIAKNIISLLKNFSMSKNCYKIILNCNDKYIGVYEKCDFIKNGNEMSLYL